MDEAPSQVRRHEWIYAFDRVWAADAPAHFAGWPDPNQILMHAGCGEVEKHNRIVVSGQRKHPKDIKPVRLSAPCDLCLRVSQADFEPSVCDEIRYAVRHLWSLTARERHTNSQSPPPAECEWGTPCKPRWVELWCLPEWSLLR